MQILTGGSERKSSPPLLRSFLPRSGSINGILLQPVDQNISESAPLRLTSTSNGDYGKMGVTGSISHD